VGVVLTERARTCTFRHAKSGKGLVIELTVGLQPLLLLESNQGFSGTRAQDSVGFPGIKAFLLQGHLRLP
jgi:hypothetical protein